MWLLCLIVMKVFFPFSQIDRMEQFFVAEGLPHLMFYYQNTEPNEAGRMKMDTHCVTN